MLFVAFRRVVGMAAGMTGVMGVALASQAGAGVVTLNFDETQIAGSSAVMDARYRVSQTNWDQMISTSTQVSTQTLAASTGLGNNTALNGAAWDFTLAYTPASGYAFTLAHASGGTPEKGSSTIVWNSTFNGVAYDRPFNALELFSVVGSAPTGVTSMLMEATNLAFAAPGHSVVGTLRDLTTTGGLERQWIYADFDLSQTSWTLTGSLRGSYVGPANANLDERIKFDVKAASVTLIPAPGAAALLGVCGVLAARRRRA